MRREVPLVRIWPMSDRIPGFRGREIADVQGKTFLRDLPAGGGTFRYPSAGLNAPEGTVVLFQFRGRIIASGVFVRDEKFKRPLAGSRGRMHFDPASFRVFEPVDVAGMRAAWPGFQRFGHVKQYLNPANYPRFVRRLKNVKSSTARR